MPQDHLPSRALNPSHLPFLLMALAFLLCVFGIFWGLPNLYDFAQDSVVPTGSLAQVGASFEELTAWRYPPFHFWVLRAAFLPVHTLAPRPAPDDPAAMKVASTFYIFAARLVSLAMALGAVWLVYRTGRRLWGAATGLAAGLLFVLSPVTLYYAKNANLDIPYVFWLAWAFFLYARILQENRRWDYLALGVTSALAVCTKDQAAGFVAFIAVGLLPQVWRAGRNALALILLGVAGFTIPFVLIHNLLFDPESFFRHVATIRGPASVDWRDFTAGPVGQLRLLTETLLRLMDAWTPLGVGLAVGGLAVVIRAKSERRLAVLLLLPVVGYYLAFPAVVGYMYPRYVLPMLVVLALFAGRAVAELWKNRMGRCVAVASLVWIGLAGLALDYVMSEYARYPAQRWLERVAEENPALRSRIYYVGDERDMPRFNLPLDPHPLPADMQALTRANPPVDLLVLSFEPCHPATGSECWRVSSLLRRRLGTWGLLPGRRAEAPNPFVNELLAGRAGFKEVARFESPIAPFVPEVAESVNRTIIVLGKP